MEQTSSAVIIYRTHGAGHYVLRPGTPSRTGLPTLFNFYGNEPMNDHGLALALANIRKDEGNVEVSEIHYGQDTSAEYPGGILW